MTRRGGLTLVEMLVVCALVALISASLVAGLAGGLRVWERSRSRGIQDQWILLAFDGLRRDLRRVRPFAPIPVEGDYESVSVPALVTMGTAGGEDLREPGRVSYFFDSRQGMLCRSSHAYRWMRRHSMRDSCEPVLEHVSRVRFEYFAIDEHGAGEWLQGWSAPTPPAAVRIRISSRSPGAETAPERTLTVTIPSGGAGAPGA
ncbi:MAG TPA: type II secretion system protein [bacterium]